VTERVLVDTTDGLKEYAHFDKQTGDLLCLEREEDVESVLEWCKGRYNDGLANSLCEFRHVARFPHNVIHIFAKKWGIDPNQIVAALGKDKDLTSKLLNDRDLGGFRTLPGTY
jgi:hypothetical protein